MGIDAALFSSDGQMFYYDREYNLKPPLEYLEYDGHLLEKWDRLSGKEGLSKQELENYLRTLLHVFKGWREEVIYNKTAWVKKVLKWVARLSDKCKLISRNDTQDEYFKLCKKEKTVSLKR